MSDHDDVGVHTFPLERADALEDPSRYRFCSREELLADLDPDPDATVADLGSGTGFYARDVSPFVRAVYAVDVQGGMHALFRERGVPENVEFVTASVGSLPVADDSLDGAFSTMTHHEYADPSSFAELARALRPGARLVTVDWSADGRGDDGPPLEDRFGSDEAAAQLEDSGFDIVTVRDRPETFVVVAVR
ncbi:class I SAM-dependent methyltransferase [Natrialbaceae archaeon GCM10025810]|uniref:class I SAM-dependent methyltransferase n=1 Tax=Halovalidus salilacus TaxID=3075124 RepID=UPI00361051FD